MTDPRIIRETTLLNKNGESILIKTGDRVDLRPLNLVEDDRDRDEKEYFFNRNQEFYHGWIGEGPYTVDQIGQWPCGRIMLYLKTPKSSGAGVYASDLVYVGKRKSLKN